MSDIPYVNQLGDAIEAAIAREPEPARRRQLPRIGGLRGRRGAAVVLAALAIGGAAARTRAHPAELDVPPAHLGSPGGAGAGVELLADGGGGLSPLIVVPAKAGTTLERYAHAT